ncbi:radical SAM protein [bacterium]|nr:radical SAM protein [bacterium]
MAFTLEETPCKTALTGNGRNYRLNPCVGCIHGCHYCYATYLTHWRAQGRPWGSWVQVKANIAGKLERELRRKRGIHVFMSTTCDVYQPISQALAATRACLEVLQKASQHDPLLQVMLLTKSDLVLRDLDVLRAFRPGALKVGFSICTLRDDMLTLFEPNAPRPLKRVAAACELREAGIRTAFFISPVLPYVTERELPDLLKAADDAGIDSIGFDTLNYLHRHVGPRVRPLYAAIGPAAVARLERAARERDYGAKLHGYIKDLLAKQPHSFTVDFMPG